MIVNATDYRANEERFNDFKREAQREQLARVARQGQHNPGEQENRRPFGRIIRMLALRFAS